MATTSSPSSSERTIARSERRSSAPLLGCGVDLERPDRFRRYVDPNADIWPLVFSRRELDHARSLAEPHRALCASFCAKEAFTKALRAPFEYTECELLYDPAVALQTVHIGAALATEHRTGPCEAEVTWPSADECLVTLYLYAATP